MANELLSKTTTISYDGVTIARLTGWTLEVNKETVDTTNIDVAGWKEMLVDLKEWSINFDGIVIRSGTGNYGVTLGKLLDSDIAATATITDTSASNVITGSGFITTSPLSGSIGDKQTFSGTIKGTGTLSVNSGSYSTEATAAFALYDSLGDGLTTAEKGFMSTYIDAEVLNGNHAKKDYDIIYALSGTNALVDYIGGKVSTLVNAPTHSADGYILNGTNQYLNSNFNLSTDSTNFLQDNGMLGYLNAGGTWVGNHIPFGVISTERTYMLFTSNTGGAMIINQTLTTGTLANANYNSKNLNIMARDGATSVIYYKNGVNSDTTSIASVGIPNANLFIGANNSSGSPASYAPITMSSFIISAEIGFSHSSYNTNLRSLLTSLGVTL